MGIVLEVLLGIKQVVVLKIPVGKSQGILQLCGTTTDLFDVY